MTWFYAAAGLALLLVVLVFGADVNGAKLNIDLGFFVFQPSEFVKIIFVFLRPADFTRKKLPLKIM